MKEYWKWPESRWWSDKIDWKAAGKITAGVDLGTTSTQAVIMCDGELFAYANIYTSADYEKTANDAIQQAMGDSGMQLKDIGCIVGTGWGKDNVSFSKKQVDEIHCHARGARFMFGPKVKTVVDLGAQSCKVMSLYVWNRVRNFMINDKCATGMGRSLEVLSYLMGTPIEEMGEKSLQVESDPEPVSTTCYAFAQTETIGLFRAGYSENEALAAHHFAEAWRILGVIGRINHPEIGDFEPEKEIAFTGGLAKNAGIVKRLERELKMDALTSDYDCQLAGAIGAALLAYETSGC